ncbi:MAG: translation initiation factor IF-2 [Endomicrobium sp.]|jgi:translation initiation factor IF-2|nr:translation initiation factor IF-2 [Endomicrobium sp.]
MTPRKISKIKGNSEERIVKKKIAKKTTKKVGSKIKIEDKIAKKTTKKVVNLKKIVKSGVIPKKIKLKSKTKIEIDSKIKSKPVIKTISEENKFKRKRKFIKDTEKEIAKEDLYKRESADVCDSFQKVVDSNQIKKKEQADLLLNVVKPKCLKERLTTDGRKHFIGSQEKSHVLKTGNLSRISATTDDANLILISELTTVKDLADKMKLMYGDVLKKLLLMGSISTVNQRLDADTATLLANEFGYNTKFLSIYSEEKINIQKEDLSKSKPRPAVVTIMGHVDHGKTSLLDVIRSSNIVEREHGGITQHIGAYKVKMPKKEEYIVFLDTPGHEAFTAMRSRGTQVTDIVILVVSANDGVMPQTIEAISHAKVANVPIIVAINKIDLPTADSKKVRQELSNHGLIPEEWGGDVIMIDISAKQKININFLLEMILLKAEMMELKSNPDKNAEGVVVEAKLDSRRGPVATLLVQSGTLKIGDNIVVGTAYGKIRAMINECGEKFNKVFPSTPIEVLGIGETPQVGDKFVVVNHESYAREIVQSRKVKIKEASLKPKYYLSLADINSRRVKSLRIILKTDVQGSLGALSDSLEKLSTSEISLKIIHKGAGAITESDVALAVASNALIIGFNLRPDVAIEKIINSEGVSINIYRIIYDLISDVKAAMEGMLEPDVKEKIIGKATVRQIFKLSNHEIISGCFITDGKIQKSAKVRLLRNSIIIFEGNISSLKRFKDDVKEVEKGYECGICFENFSDIKLGDIIENFTIEKISRKLNSY